MIGRQVAAVLHGSLNARLVRPIFPKLPIRLSARVEPSTYRRCYATPGRPKKAVGEAGKPIKRASKKSATPKASKSTAKKAAPKKKPAKKAKKELTPKQIEAAKARAERLAVRQLKQAALDPPPVKQAHAYVVFVQSRGSSLERAPGQGAEATRRHLADFAKQCAASWKSLSPAEREHFNHVANQKARESEAARKEWVQSHTVEQIHAANLARLALRRRATSTSGKLAWPLIQDERVPKRPSNPYVRFASDRIASGDFKHMTLRDYTPLIAQEWKELSDGEKQRYTSAQDNTLTYDRGTQTTAASATA